MVDDWLSPAAAGGLLPPSARAADARRGAAGVDGDGCECPGVPRDRVERKLAVERSRNWQAAVPSAKNESCLGRVPSYFPAVVRDVAAAAAAAPDGTAFCRFGHGRGVRRNGGKGRRLVEWLRPMGPHTGR